MKRNVQVHIVLRQSPDWKTQTYQDLEKTRQFCRDIGRPETLIIDRVKLWDKTFGLGFFQCRQVLKDLSMENFRAVKDTDLVMMDKVPGRLSRDSFYLFTDDDDWFHPDIASRLRQFDPRSCAALHWDSAVLSKGISVLQDGMYWSNNYAVSGEYLLQRRENVDIVSQHYRADGAFRSRLTALHRRMGYGALLRVLFRPGYRVQRHVGGFYSVENKHPASTVVLEQLGNAPDSDALRSLIRDIRDGYRKRPPSGEFEWVDPYAARVGELCSRLLNEAD